MKQAQSTCATDSAIRGLAVVAALLGAATAFGADVQWYNPADWSVHGQLTYQAQGHGAFSSPYAGEHSFESRREVRGSFTSTLYVGRRLWRGGELYVNPELIAGAGLSRVLGLAGPPNGETYRVDTPDLKLNLARVFLRQTWNFGDTPDTEENTANQLAVRRSPQRIMLTVGKVSGTDIFDGNAYAHDARTQFNNWSLWANAAWDYPADTRGYTWGIALEWYQDRWAVRGGSFMEPTEANGAEFDHDVRHAHGEVLEVEHDHTWGGQSGALRFLAFENHAGMGVYRDAIALNPAAPDVTATRAPGRVKYGFGVNVEQAITKDVGMFLRAGWNDGKTESWAFTEVERTLSLGVSSGGAPWRRPDDHVGAAIAVNGLNSDHREYLAAGGLGFMLGDGALTYAAEEAVEAYYLIGLGRIGGLSFEAQHFANLGANRDRGPVTVYGARIHLEF